MIDPWKNTGLSYLYLRKTSRHRIGVSSSTSSNGVPLTSAQKTKKQSDDILKQLETATSETWEEVNRKVLLELLEISENETQRMLLVLAYDFGCRHLPNHP